MYPNTYIIGELRGLKGKARVSFPTDKSAQKRVERILNVQKDGWQLEYGTADEEHTDSILTGQDKLKEDGQYVEVYRVWEVLPGVWIPFTRYDDQLGPIQGRRRAVVNSGQTPSLTGTKKTTYEGRDGSAYVLWEIEENWTDGTGGTGNPAYPIQNAVLWDDVRGSVNETRQIVVKTGEEQASRVESEGTVTETTYEPFNEFLLIKVVQTWTLSGPKKTPAVQYPTPDTARDFLIVERQLVDPGENPITYGTAHPSISAAKLIDQKFEDGEGSQKVRVLTYSANGNAAQQSAYNAALSYLSDSNAHQALVRTFSLPRSGYAALAKGTADPVVTAAKLVRETAEPIEGDAVNYRVIRIYETLPGPWLPANRYDDQLGSVTGRRRAVINTGQAATLSATGRTTYESREGSAYVLWETEETWSDGSGEEGNPAYPIQRRFPNDNLKGPVRETRQLVVRSGSETASISVSEGVATETTFEPYNEFLLSRVIEVYTVGAVSQPRHLSDPLKGPFTLVQELVVRTGSETASYAEDEGAITAITFEPYNSALLIKATETYSLNASDLPRSFVDSLRGPVKEIRKLIVKTGDEEASRVESSGTVTTTEYDPYPDNPQLLVRIVATFELSGPLQAGQAISTQYGGGILDTKRQYVEEGTLITGNWRRVGGEVQPDGQGGAVLQTSDLPSDEDWPTLKDQEYVSELKGFIKTEKTVVEDLDQSGSATGGSGGNDRVVTEYRGLDKWRSIQIVSRIPWGVINSTQTFKKTINFSLPNEIRAEPAVVRAFATYLPSRFASRDYQEVYMDAITSDMGLDWQIHKGKSGPFVCNVTRTISTSSEASEVAVEFDPRAERVCVGINRPAISSVSKMAGRVMEFTFPEALHGAWNFEIANMFTPSGLWVKENPEDTETLLTDPEDIQDFFDNLTAGNWWRTAFTNEPIYVTRDATSPAAVPRDTPFILAVNSEEWRYGLWVHDVYRYTLPS